MDQNFNKRKILRTYTKSLQKSNSMSFDENSTKKGEPKVPLSTKDAVKYLLEGTLRLRVCRYCLSVTSELSELDEVIVIAINGSLHEVTIRDMVASFHPYKVNEDANFPNKICTDCVNRTLDCYLFAQKCEQSERALRNCFDDMYEKMERLDPLEPKKKRGKRKQNPNHNTLYTKHNNVINYADPIINIINVDSFPIPHNEISELECQKCWQVMPNMESLVNHEKSHPKSMWYNCKICGKSFIKRFHLKRHLKEMHLFDHEEEKRMNSEHFKCNECGTVSNTLGDHLQHMEKHKFKVMLKELMERKVDNLCSVCLEKGSRMSNLGEVVSLYGGYPDIVGDKSIQNILNTTIPEQYSYKFREQLVANPAAVLKIVQKEMNADAYKIVKKIKLPFEFSNPIVNETSLVLDDLNTIYTFAKPLLINPFEVRKEDVKEIAKVKLQITYKEIPKNLDKLDIIKTDNKIETITTDYKINEIQKIVQSCKLCWIFKKPSCKDCLNASKDVDKYISENNKEVCKHWIFDKCKKCTICENNVSFEISSIHYKKKDCNLCWIFHNIGKCDACKMSGTKTTIFNINEDKKLNKLLLTPKLEWKCNICLTNNKDCYTCICCDNDKDNTKRVAVSNQNYTFLNKYERSNRPIEKSPKNSSEILKTFKKSVPDNQNQYKVDYTIGTNTKILKNEVNLYKSQNIAATKVIPNITNEDMSMDIEITPNLNFNNQIKTNDVEAMDIEENDTQSLMDCRQEMQNVTQPYKKSLDFNYQTRGLNTRRVKRPLRRMATPFQK